MKRSLQCFLLTIACLASNLAFSQTRVTVGVYDFPPIAIVSHSGKISGLITDILNSLNSSQSEFYFVPFTTSSKRRYLDFANRRYDVIFFESLDWGWQTANCDASRTVLADDEVYVALNKPDRDQTFFDHLAERRLVAILGYHYGFANLSIDEHALHNHFNIELSRSHQRNMELILADRPAIAEVAVVSRAYLSLYLDQHPEARSKLMVSDQIDQRYQLRIITHPDSPVSSESLEALLNTLIEDGSYPRMAAKYHLIIPSESQSEQSQARDCQRASS